MPSRFDVGPNGLPTPGPSFRPGSGTPEQAPAVPTGGAAPPVPKEFTTPQEIADAFRRNGGFDSLRRSLLTSFTSSGTPRANFEARLEGLVRDKLAADRRRRTNVGRGGARFGSSSMVTGLASKEQHEDVLREIERHTLYDRTIADIETHFVSNPDIDKDLFELLDASRPPEKRRKVVSEAPAAAPTSLSGSTTPMVANGNADRADSTSTANGEQLAVVQEGSNESQALSREVSRSGGGSSRLPSPVILASGDTAEQSDDVQQACGGPSSDAAGQPAQGAEAATVQTENNGSAMVLDEIGYGSLVDPASDDVPLQSLQAADTVAPSPTPVAAAHLIGLSSPDSHSKGGEPAAEAVHGSQLGTEAPDTGQNRNPAPEPRSATRRDPDDPTLATEPRASTPPSDAASSVLSELPSSPAPLGARAAGHKAKDRDGVRKGQNENVKARVTRSRAPIPAASEQATADTEKRKRMTRSRLSQLDGQ